MRCAYLSEDRPDIRFASKEIARLMSEPCTVAVEWQKRLVRYLSGARRLIQSMPRQAPPKHAIAWTDSDHAGCLRTRRSTSCGVLTHGHHFVKMSVTTQIPIAMSSGESELYGMTATASSLLGLQAIAADLGRTLQCILHYDATAGAGIASRRGAGKIRHLDLKALWIQQAVTSKKILLKKVLGELNISDLGTKHVPAVLLLRHLKAMGFYFADGKADISLGATFST